jgi:peptide-methionine (R)-S-oxide reductase
MKNNQNTSKEVPKALTDAELKQKLTPEQYAVLRDKGTEAPFSGKLLHESRDGTYNCVACGNPLFSSKAKFDSGTGWPSFDQALPGAVKEVIDNTHGMRRVETVCAVCGSHLGHLFDDGPTSTGKRYCMNSVCLDLESESK